MSKPGDRLISRPQQVHRLQSCPHAILTAKKYHPSLLNHDLDHAPSRPNLCDHVWKSAKKVEFHRLNPPQLRRKSRNHKQPNYCGEVKVLKSWRSWANEAGGAGRPTLVSPINHNSGQKEVLYLGESIVAGCAAKTYLL